MHRQSINGPERTKHDNISKIGQAGWMLGQVAMLFQGFFELNQELVQGLSLVCDLMLL
jgi:hypothetical protein